MRIASVAVLALLSSVALTSCSGSDDKAESDSSKKTTTTVEKAGETTKSKRSDDDKEALVKYIAGADTTVITKESSECVGDEAIDGLTDAGVTTVSDGGDFDLTKFSDADSAVLVAALDKCVDIDDALAAFSGGISSEAGLPITAEEATCTSQQFAAEYSGAGEFIKSISAMSDDESGAKLFEAMGPCLSNETAVAFMSSLLVTQQMDKALADCVAQGVVAQLGAKGLMEAITDAGAGGSTSSLGQASTDAATACATGAAATTVPG